MSAVPVVRTWTAGEVVTAAYMNNNVRDVDSWLLAAARCQAYQTVAQSIATGSSFTSVTLDAETVDTTGMHSTVSNTSRFTAVYPGWYRYSGAVPFVNNATGRRMTCWRYNGSDLTASGGGQAGSAVLVPTVAREMIIFQNVGDYVELGAQQDSGGALSTYVGIGSWQAGATAAWDSN